MHIKQILIEGFKSYQEARIDSFSPKHNAIVGPNGSGKSNFFQAIQLVIGDTLDNLGADDRRRLLHEGGGNPALSTFVEIVFENTDRRLPVDRDEVRLRRSLGVKKDDFYLDGKHIARTEVMNLLESAGFSRSNPYYIIQQGKINHLATIKPEQRLELLKEIGGTRVYESKRKESLKSLEETDRQRQRITETLEYLRGKLEEAKSDREELAEANRLERRKRATEYLINESELKQARTELQEVSGSDIDEDAAGENYTNLEAELNDIDSSLSELQAEEQQRSERRAALVAETERIDSSISTMESKVADANERYNTAHRQYNELSEKLETLNRDIENADEDLRSKERAMKGAEANEEAARKQAESAERRMTTLRSRQGRANEFTSANERDQWIDEKVSELRTDSGARRQRAQALTTSAQQHRNNGESARNEMEAKKREVQEHREKIERLRQEETEVNNRRRQETTRRREAFQKKENAERNASDEKEKRDRARKIMHSTMSKEAVSGVDAANRAAKEISLEGYYGPLIDLIDCDERFDVAVDVTGGDALFNVVVSDDETAKTLIQKLNQERNGRVGILPLNRLTQPESVGDIGTNDAVRLIDKVNVLGGGQVEKAAKHVFGKTLLCRNYDTAIELHGKKKMHCVTLDGKQVSRRGAMTGGYIDSRKSRMASARRVRAHEGVIGREEGNAERAREDAAGAGEEVTRLAGELDRVATSIEGERSSVNATNREVEGIQEREKKEREAAEEDDRKANELRAGAEEMEKEADEFEGERGTALGGLDEEEREELEEVAGRVPAEKERAGEREKERAERVAEYTQTKTKLEENLLKQKKRVELQLEDGSVEAVKEEKEEKEKEVAELRESREETNAQIGEIDGKSEERRARASELEREREEKRKEMDKAWNQYESKSTERERRRERIKVLNERVEMLLKQMRQLSPVSSDALHELRESPVEELREDIQNVNEKLKGYTHVNRKAGDQHAELEDEESELEQRANNLEQSRAKIAELIEQLDRQKDESIERTLKQVSHHFSEIFNEMVGGKGRGEIVMLRRRDYDENDEPSRLEKYQGVSMRVSFGGSEHAHVEQLSGGQKTIVALVLIFAIQRCDPAPFYLFDEIDAALDESFRASVASLVSRQASEGTQFIATTFGRDLVESASQVYGVSHTGRQSTIQTVPREDALNFVDEVAQYDNDGADNNNASQQGPQAPLQIQAAQDTPS